MARWVPFDDLLCCGRVANSLKRDKFSSSEKNIQIYKIICKFAGFNGLRDSDFYGD